jgi:hypothetical protein
MDGQRFDDLSRRLAVGIPRRQALKLLGGGLAAALALTGRGEVSAGKKCTSGADCPKNQVCGPNGTCVKAQLCDPDTAPTCGGCEKRRCDVVTGQWHCDPACDPESCCLGSCSSPCTNNCVSNPTTCTCDTPRPGTAYCYLTDTCISNACRADQFFDISTCQCRCPNGQTDCGGQCVDTNTNPNNCGGCGNPATDDHMCTDPFSPQCLGGLCGCASTTHCPDGNCCTDIVTYPNGDPWQCCCNGRISWPSTGQETCNPCGIGTTFCYCNDGSGGWDCCRDGEVCAGCSGGPGSGVPICAVPL